MTIEQNRPDGLSPARRTDGVYGLPGVGEPAARAREFFDGMRPTDDDTPGVRAGKNLARYGTVVAAGMGAVAVTAVIAL